MENLKTTKQSSKKEAPIQLDAVDTMLTEIYGADAVEYFEKMWKAHPEWSLETALERYGEEPTSEQSNFFRSLNIKTVAEDLVPRLKKKQGEPVEILDVGVSDGKEAYSLAVHMLDSGHKNFNIHGVDVSLERLAEAEAAEYKFYIDSIDQLGRSGDYYGRLTPEHVQKGYFHDAGKRWQKRSIFGKYSMHDLIEMKRAGKEIPEDAWQYTSKLVVEPTKKLKKHITFDIHDIIDKPVEDKEHDIIIMNNVLLHYPEKTREIIMNNVLASLKPGGFLVLEHKMYPMQLGGVRKSEEEWLLPYNAWRDQITQRFPLKEVEVKDKWSSELRATGEFFQYTPASKD